MGILDKLFDRTTAVTQQENSQQQQQQMNPGNPGNQNLAPVVPGAPNSMQTPDLQNPGNAPAPKSPLEQFKSLFNTEQKVDKDGKPIVEANDTRYLPINKEDVAKAVAQLDFTSGDATINEMMEKFAGGDASVLPQIINQALKQSYMQQTLLTSELMEKLGNQVSERIQKEIPQRFKDMSSRSSLESDPLFKDPAAQPVVNAIRQQILQKHPEASAQDVQELTKTYLRGFAQLVNGNNSNANHGTENPFGNPREDVDWGAWFSAGK